MSGILPAWAVRGLASSHLALTLLSLSDSRAGAYRSRGQAWGLSLAARWSHLEHPKKQTGRPCPRVPTSVHWVGPGILSPPKATPGPLTCRQGRKTQGQAMGLSFTVPSRCSEKELLLSAGPGRRLGTETYVLEIASPLWVTILHL